MPRKYSIAPLPFRGSKRYYVKRFRKMLNKSHDIDTVVDLFGGSGLLSRVAKDELPACRVIYNDFDRYIDRLANIDHTNALLRSIRSLLINVPESKKLPAEVKKEVLTLMSKAEQKGPVDYITLSASLLFSGNYATSLAEMEKQTMYNRVVLSDYKATNYLDGLEVVHEDYKDVFARFKGSKKVLFVIDPPYLQTEHSAYKKEVYWQLKDYLDVLALLKGTNYVLFTSEKSQILELCEWINENYKANLLEAADKWEQNSPINGTASYKDIMIAKL